MVNMPFMQCLRFLILVFIFLPIINIYSDTEEALDIPSYVILAQDKEELQVPYGHELWYSKAENLINEPLIIPPLESSEAMEIAFRGIDFPQIDLIEDNPATLRVLSTWNSQANFNLESQLNILPFINSIGLYLDLKQLSKPEEILRFEETKFWQMAVLFDITLLNLSLSIIQENHIKSSQSSIFWEPRISSSLGFQWDWLFSSSSLKTAFPEPENYYLQHKSELSLQLFFLSLELTQEDFISNYEHASVNHMTSAALHVKSPVDHWSLKAGILFDYSSAANVYPLIELGFSLDDTHFIGFSMGLEKMYPGSFPDQSFIEKENLNLRFLKRLFYTLKLQVIVEKLLNSQLNLSYIKGASLLSFKNSTHEINSQWLGCDLSGDILVFSWFQIPFATQLELDLITFNLRPSFELSFMFNWFDFLVCGPGAGMFFASHLYPVHWIFDYTDAIFPSYLFFEIMLPHEKHIDIESRFGIYINNGSFYPFGEIAAIVNF